MATQNSVFFSQIQPILALRDPTKSLNRLLFTACNVFLLSLFVDVGVYLF